MGQKLGANKILKFSYEAILCSKEKLRTWLCLYKVTMAVDELNYLLVSYMTLREVKLWCFLLGKQPDDFISQGFTADKTERQVQNSQMQ